MRPLRRVACFWVTAGAFAAGGCGITESLACTLEARPGIMLEVVDIVTGLSPLVPSVITVTDGGYQERYPPAGAVGGVLAQYGFAYERAGQYSILVQTPGFLDWSVTGVVVRDGDCNVETVRVVARLQR